MKSHLILFLLFLLAFISIAFFAGCSSAGGSLQQITSPDTGQSAGPTEDGHILMGIYTIGIDVATGQVDVVRDRRSEAHFNITSYVLPPACPDCFKVALLGYDPVAKHVSVRLTLKNPTNLTAYDVRGIILDFGTMTIVNPDSYTKLFGPGNINPFVAWMAGPQRAFLPMQIYQEDITIYNPFYPTFSPFTYVIEASWPTNAKEPYEINPFNVAGDLQSDGSNTVTINVAAYDWQDDIESVSLDLTPLGGSSSVQMTSMGGNMYQKQIAYVAGPGEGFYHILIIAKSVLPALNNTLYNYCTVHVVGPGTEFPVEFGNEERISDTPGQSFIWPKHAMAIDSAGRPHVVWADNDPDPYSHLFKLLYSTRNNAGVWQAPKVVGSASVDAVYATLCIDGSDVIHIVWEDQRAGQLSSDIYYTNSSSNFATEVKLTSTLPQVRHSYPHSVLGNSLLHIAWFDNRNDIDGADFDVYYKTYNPASGVQGNEIAVAASGGVFEGYPSIDIDADSQIHVAYQKFESTMKIYQATKSGLSFGAPTLVAGNKAYQPAIDCGNSANDVFIAYFDYSDGTFSDVWLASSNNGGASFGAPFKVSNVATEYEIHPDVIQGQFGDIYIVWAEEGYIDVDGTPGPDDLNGDNIIDENDAVPHRVYFRQRMGQQWLSAKKLTTDSDSSAFPQIAVGPDQFVHVSYMKWTLDTPYDNYELYYRKSLPF